MPLALFLLIVLPLAEIYVFIEVGARIGALTTVLLILATAAAGLALFRYQGFTLRSRVREAVASDTPPVAEMLDGLGLAVMAVLLLIPGFVTDALGLLLAVPAIRRWLLRLGLLWLRGRVATGRIKTRVVIDGDFRDVTGKTRNRGPDDPDPPRLGTG